MKKVEIDDVWNESNSVKETLYVRFKDYEELKNDYDSLFEQYQILKEKSLKLYKRLKDGH